jgi:hypothetical protein
MTGERSDHPARGHQLGGLLQVTDHRVRRERRPVDGALIWLCHRRAVCR